MGCDNLSIKLTERGRTTEWLLNVAEAYHNRSYNGNLIDIINYVGKGNFYGKLHYAPVREEIKNKGYNEKAIKNYRESIFYTLPYLDNKKLDKFINHFMNNYKCDEKICDDGEIELLDSEAIHGTMDENGEGDVCTYCGKWAKRALVMDQEERLKAIKRAEQALDDVNESKIFYASEGDMI